MRLIKIMHTEPDQVMPPFRNITLQLIQIKTIDKKPLSAIKDL